MSTAKVQIGSYPPIPTSTVVFPLNTFPTNPVARLSFKAVGCVILPSMIYSNRLLS